MASRVVFLVDNRAAGLVRSQQVPQIFQNFKQGHTGVLSIITVFMNVGGNGARIATSLKEGLALVVIGGFVLNLAMNVVLLLQILVYWKATVKAMKGAATKKKD